MSIISHPRKPGGASGPHGQRLRCPRCGTDEHLIIESIEALTPPKTGWVDVAYTCIGCDYFYAHTADIAEVAAVLNRPGRGYGVLQFGGEYLHCGEPMAIAGSEYRSIHAPISTEQQGDGALEVYLRTRVLRCGCGFQMEIPD
jgi:hypothetical protein